MSGLQQGAHEVRVHGIGDKDPLSSLGPPKVLQTVGEGRADVVEPPPVPPHRLSLVNWSRWNRTGWAVAWILCWPFTVLNAGAQMRPSDGRVSRVHSVTIHAFSLLATVVSYVWVAAALEAAVRVVPTPDALRGLSGHLAVGLAGLLLVAVIMFRASRTDRPPVAVSLVHAVAVVTAAAAVMVLRPSQRVVVIDNPLLRGLAADSYTTDDFARIPATYAAQGAGDIIRMTQYADPLAWVGYGSLAAAGLALLLGMAAEKAPSTQCALVTSAVAMAVVNLYGTVLFAASKTVVSAVAGYSTVERFLRTPPRLDDALLVGRTGHGYSTHVLPLVALLTVLVIVVPVAMIAARLPVATVVRRRGRRETLNRWAHRQLPRVGQRLTNAMWVAAVLVLLLVEFLGLGIGVLADRWGGYEVTNGVESYAPGRPATLLLVGAGLVLTALLFAVRNASIRARLTQSLAFIGDVIGFWPVQTHPFAAQSYRPAAIAAIGRSFVGRPAEPTALVGHSQGSVLAAWYVAHDPDLREDLALITCGSPLMSLYGQFFPAHFGDDFFRLVISRSRWWTNVWRDTDPIATTIPAADCNRKSTDPQPGEELRCHSHYWTDPDQATSVREALGLEGGALLRRAQDVAGRS